MYNNFYFRKFSIFTKPRHYSNQIQLFQSMSWILYLSKSNNATTAITGSIQPAIA